MGIKQAAGGGVRTIFIDIKGRGQPYKDDKGGERFAALVQAPMEKGGEKVVLDSYTHITGRIADVKVESNEFQGDTIHSLKVKLVEEGQPNIQLTVGLGSYLGAKFAGLVNAALKKPGAPIDFTAGYLVEGEKMGEKIVERGGTWLKMMQDGVRLQPVYAGGIDKLPDAPKVKVSGKEMTDMTPVNEVVAATIVEATQALSVGPTDLAHDDEGLSPGEVAGAVEAANADRAGMRARG